MLTFDDNTWRFDSPGPLSADAVAAIFELINRIAGQFHRKAALEVFKEYFASAAGEPYYPSSSESWAATDLEEIMDRAAKNAPLFIDEGLSLSLRCYQHLVCGRRDADGDGED